MSVSSELKDQFLEWVYSYLERDEEIVVPIKKMWKEWNAGHLWVSLPDFTAAILADERFEAMGEVDHTQGMEWLSPEELAAYEEEMEAMGFYSGPRVKLRSRELTLEHIARMIKKHNDRLEESLRQAREHMPPDISEQEEGMLLDAIAMAAELRRKLREAGLEPPEEE